jgi:hypothetical protein
MALNVAAADMWQPVLKAVGNQPDIVRQLVLLRRRPRHELHLTVRTLIDALAAAEPKALRMVRASARGQRSQDAGAFDAAWREADGHVPPWLTIDPSIEASAIAWWNTPTWALSRDYLKAHPALLDPGTDIVLEEFRFEGDEKGLVDRHLGLLAAARAEGVDAAFAPLLTEIEASEWIRSEDPKEHLAEHPQLLRPEIAALLDDRTSKGDGTAAKFGAILTLAQRNERDLAFKALDDPNAVVEHLQPAWRSMDSARLAALATIVYQGQTAEEAARRKAAVALAIAMVLQHDEEGLDQFLAETLDGATGEERNHLATLVGDAIAHHPAAAAELARLVPLLREVAPPKD